MSVTPEAVREAVRRYICDTILPGEDPANLEDTTPLKDSGILDSVTTLELVSHLEGQYGVEIAPHEAASGFDTIGEISNLIAGKAAG